MTTTIGSKPDPDVALSQMQVKTLAVYDERNQDEVPLIAYLAAHNRSHRVAYICRNVHGQHAAIVAGLCVALLVEGSMVPGERAYLEPEGFPVFRELTIRLERARKKSEIIDRLEKHFLDVFAPGR